jgi:predicted transposase/invertase (TIGR01784 family)
MAGKWDSFTKRLIGMRPEQYARWLMPNATLISPLDIELKAQHFFADALIKVLLCDQPALMHVELQTYEDPTMGKRMLEYNILAEHQYELPTCSFVIHLRKRRVDKAPYVRRFVDGGITHRFHFRVVKLWEVTAQSIVDLGWDGLLPLLPLTKGGKRPEMVQIMIDRLAGENGDKDLLALAEMLGGLAFTKESEKAWFKRRFAMFQDIMKDSWVYQEIVQNSEERGLELGIQSHRQAIVDVVRSRFPQLADLAAQYVARLRSLDDLRILTVSIASAQDAEAVRRLLTNPANS